MGKVKCTKTIKQTQSLGGEGTLLIILDNIEYCTVKVVNKPGHMSSFQIVLVGKLLQMLLLVLTFDVLGMFHQFQLQIISFTQCSNKNLEC